MFNFTKRQSIPVIRVSFWGRIRNTVSSVAARIASVVKRTAARVVRTTKAVAVGTARTTKAVVLGTGVAIARVARAAMVRRPWVLTRDGAKQAVSSAASWCNNTWHRVLRPFLQIRVAALAVGAVTVGLFVAPVVTVAITAGCGLVLVAAAKLILVLEKVADTSSAARTTLKVIEVLVQIGRVLVYAATAAFVVAASCVSMVFLATEVLELVLRFLNVPNAFYIALITSCVLTGNWFFAAFAALAMMPVPSFSPFTVEMEIEEPVAKAASYASERQEIPVIHDIIDTEVTVSSSPCMGCDRSDGGPRFSAGKLAELCHECFSFVVQDELIKAAESGQVSAENVEDAIRQGVSVPAAVIIASNAHPHHMRVQLDLEDITCRMGASVRAHSEADHTKIFWLETAWWFDGRGVKKPVQWHGFVKGFVETFIVFEHAKHQRGFYAMSIAVEGEGSWSEGPFRTLFRAQEIAADEISDRAITARQAAGDVSSPVTRSSTEGKKDAS